MTPSNLRGLAYLLASAGLASAYLLKRGHTDLSAYSHQPSSISRNISTNLEDRAISKDTKVLILERKYQAGKNTEGRLFEDSNGNKALDSGDKYLATTIELPWNQNRNDASCIPEGTYNVKPRAPSKRFKKKHFLVENVPNRTGILIHGVGRSKGCIMTPRLAELTKDYRSGFELIIQ